MWFKGRALQAVAQLFARSAASSTTSATPQVTISIPHSPMDSNPTHSLALFDFRTFLYLPQYVKIPQQKAPLASMKILDSFVIHEVYSLDYHVGDTSGDEILCPAGRFVPSMKLNRIFIVRDDISTDVNNIIITL
jgi:hypothetical protein